jgi:ATP-dependent DNA ligase
VVAVQPEMAYTLKSMSALKMELSRPFGIPACHLLLGRLEPLPVHYLFGLKQDGFRALANVDRDGTWLVSRRGNVYRSFPRLCDAIRSEVKCDSALDARWRMKPDLSWYQQREIGQGRPTKHNMGVDR